MSIHGSVPNERQSLQRHARRLRDAAPRRGRRARRGRVRPAPRPLRRAGLDGVLAFGTNGEGVLFSVEERQRGLRLFVEAAAGRLRRCRALRRPDDGGHRRARGAMPAEAGADAVAVIGPPYFPLDEPAQLAHFAAAAARLRAAAVLRLRVRPHERLRGRARRAAAAPRTRRRTSSASRSATCPGRRSSRICRSSSTSSSGPKRSSIEESKAVPSAPSPRSRLRSRSRSRRSSVTRPKRERQRSRQLRAGVERFPRQAAMKRILAARGVPIRPDVRAPLRDLSGAEAEELATWLGSL